MFYVIYRADGPAHQLYASTHMFKTRESAQIHAEAYPSGRNAVVVEGPECLLPGGSKISFKLVSDYAVNNILDPDAKSYGTGVDDRVVPTELDYLKFAVTTLNETERLWDEGKVEEAAQLLKTRLRDSQRLRDAIMGSSGFRPLIKKMAEFILKA